MLNDRRRPYGRGARAGLDGAARADRTRGGGGADFADEPGQLPHEVERQGGQGEFDRPRSAGGQRSRGAFVGVAPADGA